MTKFRIEGDYYIVVDEYSYNLAKYLGSYIDKRDGERERWDTIGYFISVEKALNAYLELSIQEKLVEAGEGELRGMVNIISSETKRLSETLRTAFREVMDWHETR